MWRPRLSTPCIVYIIFRCVPMLSQITTKGTSFETLSHGDEELFEDSNADDSPYLNEELFLCSATSSCGYLAKSKKSSKYSVMENLGNKNIPEYKTVIRKMNSGFKDCREAQKEGLLHSQIIDISWRNGSSFRGLCNMEIDQGGWTVFQRRFNAEVNFTRNWTDFVNGFGSLQGNFWLGLEALHQMTNKNKVTLRIDLKDKDGDAGYAKYSNFNIGSAKDKYRLRIGEYEGNITDSLRYSSGMAFTTEDNDNDMYSMNCASRYRGPWWHKFCFTVNLNNEYYYEGTNIETPEAPNAVKMSWYGWKNIFGTITYSEMKLRIEDQGTLHD